MKNQNTYSHHDYNTICDACGFKFKASDLRKRWDGLMVCSKDYEIRHPMDFQRVPRTEKTPDWVRPESSDVFIGPTYTTTPEDTIPPGNF